MAARYWIILGSIALAAVVLALLLGRPATAGGQAPGLPDSAVIAMRDAAQRGDKDRFRSTVRAWRPRLSSTASTT